MTISPVYSITPFTMLDYPDKVACIVWMAGCNMRCIYCHNPEIVTGRGRSSFEEVLDFLEVRSGLLDGVVISGGEATCVKILPLLLEQIKRLGYAVKLDSNGTHPEMIRDLFERDLLDFVALDYKSPFSKFKSVTGTGARMWKRFQETLDYLCACQGGKFEVRTTVHSGIVDEAAVNEMISDLEFRRYEGVYSVQNFQSAEKGTLGKVDAPLWPFDPALVDVPHGFTIRWRNF